MQLSFSIDEGPIEITKYRVPLASQETHYRSNLESALWSLLSIFESDWKVFEFTPSRRRNGEALGAIDAKDGSMDVKFLRREDAYSDALVP